MRKYLDKRPNVSQISEGNIRLDCRYLNFAPQLGLGQVKKD